MSHLISFKAWHIAAVLAVAIASFTVADARASKTPEVQMIVEARMIKPGVGSKFHWVRIEIKRVIKAADLEGCAFPKVLDVAQRYDESEVPERWCEVCLVPFNSKIHPDTWKVAKWSELKVDKTEHGADIPAK